MKFYQKTLLAIVGCTLIFYGGYRLGLVYGTQWATEILVDMGKFHVAARSSRVIRDLHSMKSNLDKNRVALCQMKDLAMQMAEDLESCRQSSGCKKELEGPIYRKSEDFLLEFKKISCP